ncbi:hypothetical protein P7C70_g4599, partial [Phenoliferia sp. Uapishka_3]
MKLTRAILHLAIIAHTTFATQIVSSLPDSASTFDYIIVGGGTAGLVLANRLSGDERNFSVLVIEAGEDPRGIPMIEDPNQMIQLAFSKQHSWNWPTSNQTVGGKRHNILGGKVLGGSSSINGMVWTRGSKEQYDAIEALGNPSWGWEEMQNHMKKAERFEPSEESRGTTFEASARGYEGMVGTGHPTPYAPVKLFRAFVEACAQVFGIETGKDLCAGDPNSASQNSFSVHRPTLDSSAAVRSSSVISYLYPTIAKSSNSGLSVLVGHQATRIAWKDTTKVPAAASGVEFASVAEPSVRRAVRATREGNEKDLESVGIKTVINLPSVGTGLQDQTLNMVLYSYNSSLLSRYDTGNAGDALKLQDPALNNLPNLLVAEDYANSAGGPAGGALGFPSLQQLLGKELANSTVSELKRTALVRAQAIVDRGASTDVEGLWQIFLAQADIINGTTPAAEFSQFDTVLMPPGVLGVIVWNLLPQSRGSVKLASDDPFDYPSIDPAYLESEYDVLVQAACVRAARALFNTSTLASFIGVEVVPGLSLLPLDSTVAKTEEFVRASYAPVYHPVGTVAMMPKEMGGSVGPDLKIHGSLNVRVVDASVIPFQLSAHLSSTVYGIAEKAASMILASA